MGLCRACFFRDLSRRRHGVLFIIMGRLFALSRRKGAYPGPDHRYGHVGCLISGLWALRIWHLLFVVHHSSVGIAVRL